MNHRNWFQTHATNNIRHDVFTMWTYAVNLWKMKWLENGSFYDAYTTNDGIATDARPYSSIFLDIFYTDCFLFNAYHIFNILSVMIFFYYELVKGEKMLWLEHAKAFSDWFCVIALLTMLLKSVFHHSNFTMHLTLHGMVYNAYK